MFKRVVIGPAVVCALALVSLVVAAPARAQEQTHYTFVSWWAVPRAQWADFEKSAEQTNSILERLIGDGTLVAWGQSAVLVHTEDGYTHASWFVSTTQAGITKTLEALRTPSRAAALANTTKHSDLMLHSIAHGGKTGKATNGIIRVSFWRAKPGRGDDVEAFFKKYIQPDLDAGVSDGSILMYNFDSEQIHTDAPGGYNLAVVYASGEGLDKSTALLAAHAKESPAVGEGFGSMLELEAHRDSLGRVLAYQHK
jgi:hypothetical protein